LLSFVAECSTINPACLERAQLTIDHPLEVALKCAELESSVVWFGNCGSGRRSTVRVRSLSTAGGRFADAYTTSIGESRI
jgi:hypothetical protein